MTTGRRLYPISHRPRQPASRQMSDGLQLAVVTNSNAVAMPQSGSSY